MGHLTPCHRSLITVTALRAPARPTVVLPSSVLKINALKIRQLLFSALSSRKSSVLSSTTSTVRASAHRENFSVKWPRAPARMLVLFARRQSVSGQSRLPRFLHQSQSMRPQPQAPATSACQVPPTPLLLPRETGLRPMDQRLSNMMLLRNRPTLRLRPAHHRLIARLRPSHQCMQQRDQPCRSKSTGLLHVRVPRQGHALPV